MALFTLPLESAVMEKQRSQQHSVDKAAMGKIALQLKAALETVTNLRQWVRTSSGI